VGIELTQKTPLSLRDVTVGELYVSDSPGDVLSLTERWMLLYWDAMKA